MASAVATQESREAKLDLQVLQSQLTKKQQNMLNQGTVDELNKLIDDPDYGEEFVDMYRDHLNILSQNSKYTSNGYMSAVKFFALIESGNNITNAYCKVFPERLKRRLDRGQSKDDIRGEASRFNTTALVNEIRKVAGIPINLIYRHLLHEAILEQAELMRTARSEMVRQKAGDTLIRELKPTEDQVISVKVEDGTKSAIQQLREAAEKLAIQEMQSAKAGISLKTIIEGKIVTDLDEEQVEFNDENYEEFEVEPEESNEEDNSEWKY